jgi:uncharacterized membrane protein
MSEKKAFHERLAGEISLWQNEGVITPEQARSLLERYRVDAEIENKAGSGRFVSTIALLGSILLGVGVILFFAANWQYIPRAGKLAIVIISLIAVNYTGYRLKYTGDYPKVGYGLLFLGMLLFGSAIFLVAQTYHINAHFPNGFLLWGVGIIPVAYLIHSRLGIGLSIVIMGVWMGLEVTYFPEYGSEHFVSHCVMMYLAYGLFLFALGRAHKSAGAISRLQGIYTTFGVFLIMAVTYLFSFKGAGLFYGGYGRIPIKSIDSPATFFYALVILSVVLSCYSYIRVGRGDNKEAAAVASLLLIAGFAGLQINYPERVPAYQYGYGGSPGERAAIYPIVNNIVLLAEIIGALALGYWEKAAGLINAALVFFVLLVGARYFDFFWELLPRSVFFMLGGVVLIAGGIFLEKKRRRVISAIRRGAAA